MCDGGGATRRPECVRRHERHEHGAAAVEFALIAPLLFMLVFAIIDFGFGIHAWDATHNAAREGARFGAVNPSTAQIEARVRRAADFLDQSVMSVSVRCAPEGSSSFGVCGSGSSWLEGDVVRVTVSYQYSYMTPLPSMVGLGSTLLVRNVSEARFEGQ
jgi:Flp pilus assembly protein TadG